MCQWTVVWLPTALPDRVSAVGGRRIPARCPHRQQWTQTHSPRRAAGWSGRILARLCARLQSGARHTIIRLRWCLRIRTDGRGRCRSHHHDRVRIWHGASRTAHTAHGHHGGYPPGGRGDVVVRGRHLAPSKGSVCNDYRNFKCILMSKRCRYDNVLVAPAGACIVEIRNARSYPTFPYIIM